MTRTPRRMALLAALAALLLLPAAGQAQEIKVGGIFDLTGVTSDVGKPFAQGVRDATQWTNENGGINGKKIRLVDVDYGYKIPEAVSAYKRMVNDEKVIMISGWGTGDTEALKDFVGKDKIPYYSASFSGHLTDPAKFPYNFFASPSYSDQLRAWLQWVKQDAKGGTPKVAFYYGDNAYGRAPMEAGRRFAKENGIEVVDEEVLPPNFQDATSQLLTTKQKGAQYIYINVTTTGVSLVLRDAKKLGMNVKFGSNPYGFSEQLPRVAGDVAEGVTGVVPHVPYGTDVPGMKKLVDFHAKNHPNDQHDAMYVRGWATALLWTEALRRADKAGQLTGEGIKKATETLKDFDMGGLTANLTYTATDHRGTTKTPIYQVQGGKLVKVAEFEEPRKQEWLGL